MADDHSVDLAAYFRRLGYAGPTAPTLATLDALILAHVTTIPFNNLAILLDRPILLDPVSVERKLVVDGLGGYCFEQNGFMARVLRQLGYRVTPLRGRVRREVPRHLEAPPTHLCLKVDLEAGPRLVDVGFGGLSLTSSIALAVGVEQETPHEPRRIVEEDGRLFHQAQLNTGWSDAYEFTLEPMPFIDQQIANWWTSTNPASRFKSRLIVARAGLQGSRLTIDNAVFAIRGKDGVAEARDMRSPDELLAILDRHFGLTYPPGTTFAVPGLVWPDQP